MYAVIFEARIRTLDESYQETAARMRDLAMEEYGCTAFTACTEGDTEIAISYWPSLEAISAWKQDPRHLQAQHMGRQRWYSNYRVKVVEVLREYAADAVRTPAAGPEQN